MGVQRIPQSVRLVEVGLRDGLQFEPRQLPTADKVRFINRLIDAGLRWIEVGSYVSRRFVPAMADTPEVVAALQPWRADVTYTALTPTLDYLARAVAAGVTSVAVFVGATDRFNRANLKATTAVALEHARAVVERARQQGVTARGYVSVCWGGPEDPHVTPAHVGTVADALLHMGCEQISLGDTTASATPDTVDALLTSLAEKCPLDRCAVHFHDAAGRALANIDRALRFGISTVDAAVAGLGGCLASGAVTGNVATERVVEHLHAHGITTGIDLAALRDIARDVRAALQRAPHRVDDNG